MTREEMWAKQALFPEEIDYSVWDRDKAMLQQMAKINRSCTFVVDVCKGRYTFASSNFADWLGYDSRKIKMIEECDDDYLESRIHPEDLSDIKSMQVDLSRLIYSQPIGERNDYKNIFSYRVLINTNSSIESCLCCCPVFVSVVVLFILFIQSPMFPLL